jgi:uncharacterized protein (DUF58 family)
LTNNENAMLPADIIKKIKKVHIRTGRTVNTLMAGQYKSVFRGVGMEFEEVREYTPGDDVKSIDWKVSARIGRPFVKRYREERELIVMLLVDLSASGRFGTQDRIKQELAAETAAILAFNAIRNNDKVGAILFTDQVERYIPPKKGSGHVWRVIKEIFTHAPRHTGTNISEAVGFLGRVCRKHSVAFLISDFIVPPPQPVVDRQMRSTMRKHELINVLISDPGDFHLPPGGLVTVRDLENGGWITLDAFDEKTRNAYEVRQRKAYRSILDQMKGSNADCIEISTDGSAADALSRYFRRRERRKR